MRSRLLVAFLTTLATTFAGCNEEVPTPTTGNFKGTVSPENGVRKILLIKDGDTVSVRPDPDGVFEIWNVKPGSHKLVPLNSANHIAPLPFTVSVHKGETTQIPVIRMTALPPIGEVSVSINGTAYKGTPIYNYNNAGFLTFLSGQLQIQITLPANISGPGSFTTSATSNLFFKVTDTATGAVWTTPKTSGYGNLKVTYYDPFYKKGSATFSFTALRSGSPFKTGSNGTLVNVTLNI